MANYFFDTFVTPEGVQFIDHPDNALLLYMTQGTRYRYRPRPKIKPLELDQLNRLERRKAASSKRMPPKPHGPSHLRKPGW